MTMLDKTIEYTDTFAGDRAQAAAKLQQAAQTLTATVRAVKARAERAEVTLNLRSATLPVEGTYDVCRLEASLLDDLCYLRTRSEDDPNGIRLLLCWMRV